MTLIDAIQAYESADTSLKGLDQADADAQAKAAAAAAAAAATKTAKDAGVELKRGALQALVAAANDELAGLPGTAPLVISAAAKG